MDITFLGIIPARYASSRFPGKPLVDINGKSMIHRVFEQASLMLPDVVVATDDDRIFQAVVAFGGRAVFTSPDHPSGTDRCAEACAMFEHQEGKAFDVVINIQGDEPFIQPGQIQLLMDCFSEPGVQIASLCKPIVSTEELFNPNLPKIVVNRSSEAMYFSRSPIPFVRGMEREAWVSSGLFYRHIGMYAYRKEVLMQLSQLEPSPMEQAESLEQLRWLENGFRIRLAVTHEESLGIDTPEDLEKARRSFPSAL